MTGMIPPPPPPPPKDELEMPPATTAGVVDFVPPPPSSDVGARLPSTELGAGVALVPPEPEEESDEDVEMELDLPPEAMRFLTSQRYGAAITALKTAFDLTDDDGIFVMDMDRMVLAGKLDLAAYADAVSEEFAERLNEEERKRFLSRVLVDVFLPFGDALEPSAPEVAKARGLTLPDAPHFRVYPKPLTYSGAASEIARAASIPLAGGPIRERLRELVMSKVKGVRTDLQVRETFMRGFDFGGIGLDAKATDTAMAAMKDILGRAKVMSEEEYSNWLSAEARRKAEESAVLSPQSSVDGGLRTQDSGLRTPEDEEIAKIKANMPKPAIDASSELAKAVSATLGKVSRPPTDEYLA
ncbi:hypothetical protein L0Y59_03315, partial [Candidatus Uhrbacteria bacterium]|nr:hypothetical protein [Candidatus Uhrbacteria bacterium]